MKTTYYILLFSISILFINISFVNANNTSVIISEVFYDSPLNEDNVKTGENHNGEFIEFFNPTLSNILLDNWKIYDKNTRYTFPANTIIPARGSIIVAYRYPNSGFTLNSLFTKIDPTLAQKYIIYQSDIILNNSFESITLVDNNSNVIDAMSYNHKSNFESYNGYWDITARNGDYANKNVYNLVSLQRKNIHFNASGIIPLQSDYFTDTPTPLQRTSYSDAFPLLDDFYTNDDFTLPNGNATVGTTSGQFSVSPSGAATYIVPIECPIGVSGMQPNISLVYNSQSGFGMMGIGWDIGGLSNISRTSQSFAYDNNNGKIGSTTIEFNENDRFSLDGKRLVLISGTHMENGAVYGTETEDYSRITLKTRVDNNITVIYFNVLTKDGRILEYGGNMNSLIRCKDHYDILSWRLNKVTDLYGNYMEFTYDENSLYISKILYTGTTKNLPNCSIQFNYETNNINPKFSYVNKSDDWLLSNKILKDITVSFEQTQIRKYDLEYDQEYRLKRIREFNSNNESKNPITINWGDNSLRSVSNLKEEIIAQETDENLNSLSNNAFIGSGDINGDGYTDRIEYWGGSSDLPGHILVYLFNKEFNTFSTSLISTFFKCSDNELYKNKFAITDVDNDGKAEIIFVDAGIIKEFKYINGSSLSLIKSFNTNSLYHKNRTFEIFSADINHDKFSDIILVYNNYYNAGFWGINSEHLFPGYVVYYGSSSGIMESEIRKFYNDKSFNDFLIGDFDADGKFDILGLDWKLEHSVNYFYNKEFSFLTAPQWGQLCAHNEIKQKVTVDLDNDGLTDVFEVVPGIKSALALPIGYQIVYNNGGFSKEPNSILRDIDIKGMASIEKVYTLDYNGDGYFDIVLGCNVAVAGYGESNDRAEWHFFKNEGGHLILEKKIYWNCPIPKVSTGMVMDINHDGVMDLVVPKDHSFVCFTMPGSSKRDLVHSLYTSMGTFQKISYTFYENYNQQQNTNNIIQNVKYPLTIVNSFTDTDGSTNEYEFIDGKIHTEGKGFLGFKKIILKNQMKNLKDISEFDIDPVSFQLNLTKQTISTYYDKLIQTTTQVYNTRNIGNLRYIPLISSKTTIDHLSGLTTLTENLTYDANWNVTGAKTTTGSISTTVNTTYTSRTNGGVLYLPASVTVIKNNASSQFTRTSKNVFDTFGNIITETKDLNDVNELVTNYSNFDSFGHAQTIVQQDKSGKSFTSNIMYSSSGRFIKSKTNSLGETVTYDWDETYGVLKKETEQWGKGLTTSYVYDAWGKLTGTLYADGNYKTNELQWTNDGGLNGAKYYLHSSASGSSPTWIYYDELGREVVTKSYGLNNNFVYVFTQYDASGRKWRVSEPTFNNIPEKWAATYNYDDYNRIVSVVNSSNDIVSTTYGIGSVTTTSPEGTKTTTMNNAGQVDNIITNGKKVNYTYYASGLVKAITPENGQPITMEYDTQGHRTKISDPDVGTIRTKTNGFGELTEERQLIHKNSPEIITTYTYSDGLLQSVNKNNEIKIYTYDLDLGYKGRIKSIKIENKHEQKFTYDNFGRITAVTETLDNKEWKRQTIYNDLGQIIKEIYPSGYFTENSYDNNGFLTAVTDSKGNNIWKTLDENAKGQLLHEQKGNATTSYEYDERGFTTSIRAGISGQQTVAIADMGWSFDANSNLSYRTDNLTGQKESFKYDVMNRLTNWDISKNSIIKKQYIMTYDPNNGNIETKSDLGNFTMKYGENGKPHALTSISGEPTVFSADNTEVTYTDFKKIKTLTQGNKFYEITYGIDEERRKAVYKENGITKLTKYYIEDYEEEIDNIGNIRKIHYLSGGAILIIKNNVETLYYGYRDYQGSLVALTDTQGNVVERYAYSPWGERRNPLDWTQKDSRTTWIVNRGYTGHEHLDIFGIINMNGRVFDPLTAQFFSPDPYVQAPDDWLNFNRYSYCLNNPFKYTDPSGEFFYGTLGMSWSYYGGLTISVGGGIGFQGAASVGLTLSYGFKNQNFGITANASFSGFYVYAGYDTKSGFIIGAGWGLGSLGYNNGFSPGSNILDLGVSYSGVGGLSAHGFGFNYSSDGLMFDPSMSLGYSWKFHSNDRNTQSQNALRNEPLEQMIAMVETQIKEMISNTSSLPNIELQTASIMLKELVVVGKNSTELVWMKIAKTQYGVVESTGHNDGPDVAKYLKTVGLSTGEKSYWCGAFVNWTMKEAGISVTGINPAWALDWRKFGISLSKPAYGAIATKVRNGGGHVGFVAGIAPDGKIILLGGNQDDMVRYQAFLPSQLKYNFPNGYKPNYNLPIMTHISINHKMK